MTNLLLDWAIARRAFIYRLATEAAIEDATLHPYQSDEAAYKRAAAIFYTIPFEVWTYVDRDIGGNRRTFCYQFIKTSRTLTQESE